MTHTNCSHEATKAARARCRRNAATPSVPVAWNLLVKLDDAEPMPARFHRADLDAPVDVPAGQYAVVIQRSGNVYVVPESRLTFVVL